MVLGREGKGGGCAVRPQGDEVGLSPRGDAIEHNVLENPGGFVIRGLGVAGGGIGDFNPLGQVSYLGEKCLLFVALSFSHQLAESILFGAQCLELGQCCPARHVGDQGRIDKLGR